MSDDLTPFYNFVQTNGFLLEERHAKMWTRATLQQFGLDLPRGAKNALAKALPEQLRGYLKGVFWLVHFPNTGLERLDFQEKVARRSGNTDKHFAEKPIKAVFAGIRQFMDDDVERKLADSLSPEMREMWVESAALLPKSAS